MGELPRISVAVPTCRRPAFLAECLRSIVAQTLPPAEVVVSEDGEDPETKRVVAGYAAAYPQIEIRHLVNPVPLGQLANRQQAIRRTTGEFVAMLDDDDRWEERFLEVSYEALSRHGDCGFSSGSHRFMDRDGTPLERQSRQFADYCGRSVLRTGPCDRLFLLTISSRACLFPLQFSLFRRSALEQVGFFQPFGQYVPDYALMLALGLRRTKVYFIQQELGYCRVHEGQQTGRRLENAVSKAECLEEISRLATGLRKEERTALRKKYQSAVLECSIAYAHVNRKAEALRNLLRFYQAGPGVPSWRRSAVLLALLLGAGRFGPRRHA